MPVQTYYHKSGEHYIDGEKQRLRLSAPPRHLTLPETQRASQATLDGKVITGTPPITPDPTATAQLVDLIGTGDVDVGFIRDAKLGFLGGNDNYHAVVTDCCNDSIQMFNAFQSLDLSEVMPELHTIVAAEPLATTPSAEPPVAPFDPDLLVMMDAFVVCDTDETTKHTVAAQPKFHLGFHQPPRP